MEFILFSLILLAYLIGSVSTAIVVARCLQLPDPTQSGSGNPGATNMLRLSGKKVAAVVLLGDCLKGVLAVYLGKVMALSEVQLSYLALAVFLGHLYPLYFRFKGGKGVATAIGVLFALSGPLAMLALCIWLLVAYCSRLSALAAIVAAIAILPMAFWLGNEQHVPALTLLVAMLLYRHKGNMQRIISGNEPVIGEKAKSSES